MKFEDSRDAIFHDQFVEDLQYFVLNNGKIAEKILKLVKLSKRDPFKGEGNPKRLKHLGSGVVSRRITQEHRLVYLVESDNIQFLQCRFHY
ncbi:MAG: Txe/YoeB family addiction module toxin [Cyanobacteria bacterium J007]|nr:MAG: Txe/YoeB family addiction module toxin [Cyanobacteria bacterium J007]